MRAYTAHAAPEITDTAAPDPATLAAVGSGKINSNQARPMDGQTVSSSPPADQDSDVTLMESIGESYVKSDYVESAKNSPTSPTNTPDLAGHISTLEEMHEFTEVKLVKLAQPAVLFSHINKLEISDLNDAKTDLPENHQDNGATPPVNTQPYPPHPPLEDASVASAAPPPRPHVEAGNASLQAREGDLSDVRLLGADYMIYGI